MRTDHTQKSAPWQCHYDKAFTERYELRGIRVDSTLVTPGKILHWALYHGDLDDVRHLTRTLVEALRERMSDDASERIRLQSLFDAMLALQQIGNGGL